MPNLAVADGGEGRWATGIKSNRGVNGSKVELAGGQEQPLLPVKGTNGKTKKGASKNINFPSPFPGLLDEGPQTKKMGFRRKQSWKSHCLL